MLDHDTDEELAWAAGFLDGDGCFSEAAGYPMLAVSGTDRDLLEHFCHAVGVGRVLGPYDRRHPDRWSKKPMYAVQLYQEAAGVAQRVWPYLGMAKRAQIRNRPSWTSLMKPAETTLFPASSPRSVFNRENLWAAGFFDAEGCFSTTPSTGVNASITQTDRELLDRFQSIVGLGKVYGPYETHASDRYRRKPHYFFKAHGRERVQAILVMLWIWLGTSKRRQAIERLDWTTTCRKGHAKKPGHTGCAACTRAYWEGYRAQKRGDSVSEPATPYLLAAG